jgi:hypothetical protein
MLKDLDSRNRVFQELKNSDLVALIVGHRYGSIEPRSGMGWVEAEFRAAREIGKPILAFLADDQAPFPPVSIDGDRSRVERFARKSSRIISLHVSDHRLT